MNDTNVMKTIDDGEAFFHTKSRRREGLTGLTNDDVWCLIFDLWKEDTSLLSGPRRREAAKGGVFNDGFNGWRQDFFEVD